MDVGARPTNVPACGEDRSRARCTSRACSACDGRPIRGTSCPHRRRHPRRRSQTAAPTVDVTIPAPRIPLCERCVGVSAPGGPPPLSWRTLLIRRCNSFPPRRRRRPGWRTGPSHRRPSPSSASSSSARRFRRLATGVVCAGFASACCGARVRRQQASRLDHTEARRRIRDLLVRGHGQRDAAGESARVARSRSISDRRDRATDPRSPPARVGLRRPGISWPARGAEAACAPRQARVRRPRAATPARSPTRAADQRLSAASTKTVMPSVHAGSPRSPDATATVRPASADASRPSRCGPSVIGRRGHRLHGTSLIDQISVPQ